MKNYSSKAILACFFAVAGLILFTSCLPNPTEPNSSLQIPVQLNDLDSTLTAADDSLTVERVRFITGLNYFTISEDSIVYLTGYIRQLSFSPDLEDNIERIYAYPPLIGGIPEGVYQALTFKIVRAPESVPDSIRLGEIDPIFTEGGRYSLIINGRFNGEEFTYKTTEEFIYKFELPPLTVSSEAKAYVFLISAEVESWFRKDEGSGFLNPADNEKKARINANIAESFTVEQLSPE